MKWTVVLTVAALAYLPNAVCAQEDGILGAEDIAIAVKGKRLAGEWIGGSQVRVRFLEDGSLSIQDGHAVLSGKWLVQDGKLCMQVAKWNLDECGKLTRAGTMITHYAARGDKSHIVFGK
jgi:hypothetical protein